MSDARAQALGGDISTAVQRLNDLHEALTGPDGSGIIGDARAVFYRDAHHLEPFDDEIHDPDRRLPAPEGAAAARTLAVGGIDARREAGVLIDRARLGLVTAHADAGDSNAMANRAASLDAWHEQHAMALKAWARRTLSDSQIAIFYAVSHLRLKPEYRD
jgi:hypothetical protein